MKKAKIIAVFIAFILPFELNGIYNPLLADSLFWYWVADVIAWVVLPCGYLFYFIRSGTLMWGDLGLSIKNENLNHFIFVIVVISILSVFIVRSADISSRIIFPTNYFRVHFNFEQTQPAAFPWYFLVGFYYSLCAGLMEEIFYRGVFATLFKQNSIHAFTYIVLSSLIFSSVHWEGGIHRLFVSFVFGLFAAAVFVKIKNLWPLIIGHTIADMTYFCF